MLTLYKYITTGSKPLLYALLQKRLMAGKEDPERVAERKGRTDIERPEGRLYWLHAASVGEAQSALILIRKLLERDTSLSILVTTGTKTSAEMMQKKLPERTIHQYYPLDYPKWVKRFLDHWRPDFIFWMESELWPNMLMNIQKRNIPAALINARLSPRSYKRWSMLPDSIKSVLDTFSLVLCQTEQEYGYFKDLGAHNVHVSDNVKYSAAPLSFDETDLQKLKNSTEKRPLWLYASTHKGEEKLACEIHEELKKELPELLTIIVPRHPDRGREITSICDAYNLDPVRRGSSKRLPDSDTDIYVADTLGELGLFYSLSPIAVIGRSFSDDGGGGHNPIEAAQLNCAVLHGPHVQNLQDIFDDMGSAKAALQMDDKERFIKTLRILLTEHEQLQRLQQRAKDFADKKTRVIDGVMDHLTPLLDNKH